jgi:hypothetical protein
MAILIANDGDVIVANIAARNAITTKFNGMQVRVEDAIADTRVGEGSAKYEWDATLSRWLLTWKETRDDVTFTNEGAPIVNGQIISSNYPKNGTIWDVTVRDVNDMVLAYIEPVSVVDNVITLGTNQYDGHELFYTYSYGIIENAIAQISSYTLPTASPGVLGGVKIGSGLTIGADGSVATTSDAEWVVKSTSYNAVAGDKIFVDTSAGSVSITLPATPPTGATIRFADFKSSFEVSPLILLRNGSKILGISDDLSVDIDNKSITLVYASANAGWVYGS